MEEKLIGGLWEFWRNSSLYKNFMLYLSYETLFGIPPFYSENQMAMYDLIRECNLKIASSPPVSAEAKDFIKKVKIL